MKIKLPLVMLALSGLLSVMTIAPASAEDTLPKGKDYPVEVYRGELAKDVDRTDEFTNAFRTRFRQALRNNTVFAGEYAHTEWGCGGSGCTITAFINKRTGRALAHSFQVYFSGSGDDPQPIGEDILYVNKNSRLLVTYQTNEESATFYNYYLLKGDDLELIRTVADTAP